MSTRFGFGVPVLAVLATVWLGAQQAPAPDREAPAGQQPPVTFRVEVNYIEVDAVVTDQNGNFVEGLSRDDFEILEDGKPQRIETFSMIDIPVERPLQPPFASAPIEPDVRTNDREYDGRVYILVLDDLHTAPLRSTHVREAATRFIEQEVGANDLMAVVYTSGRTDGMQEFTSSRRLLLDAVGKFMGQKLRSPTLERLAEYRRQANFRRPEEGPILEVNDPTEFERGYKARNMFDTLRNVAEVLANVRGRRKTLVLLSEGIDYDIYNVFASKEPQTVLNAAYEAIGAATRANVAIYTVDPRGLVGTGDELIDIQAPADNPNLALGPNTLYQDLRLSQDSLRVLSEETGGMAFVGTNDIPGAFERIAADNSSYYLMGYYPENDRRDGRFRKIEVRVKNRPDLTVRARKGYVAPRGRPEKPKDLIGKDLAPQLREALNNPLPVAGLSLTATAAGFRGEDEHASVLVTVEIPGSELRFAEEGGVYSDRLEVSVLAVDQEGTVKGGDRHVVDMDLKPETHELISKGGLRMISRFPLEPGRYQLRIAGYETGNDHSGSVLYELEVPDFTDDKLVMGGIVLTSIEATVTRATARQDAQLQQVLPGPPSTDRDVVRGDELTLFTEVYDNVTSPQHMVDITTTVRSADSGHEVYRFTEVRDSAELRGRKGGFGHLARIPIDFEPGLYILRVEARSRADEDAAVSRELAFEVTAPPAQ